MNKKFVWIMLEYTDYEGGHVVGVFESKKAAENYQKENYSYMHQEDNTINSERWHDRSITGLRLERWKVKK